jgi:CheY-like chemotaxis protein
MLVHPLPARRIILVEDDEVLQRQLLNLLRKSFSDLDVRDAKDEDDALSLLEDESSRLLITDAQNHSFDGIALATSARKLRPTLPVIVMSNSGQAPRSGTNPPLKASWLKRPPKAERLLGLVKTMLSEPVGFTGSISIQALAELVQLLCMANVSGALHVEHGTQRGVLWFERGSIVDAALDGIHGAEVVQRMLRWQGGSFSLEREARAERTSIRVPAMQLLLEAVQVIDQESHSGVRESSAAVRVEARVEVATPPSRSSIVPATKRAAASQAPAPSWQTTLHSLVMEELESERSTPAERAAESFQRGMEFAQQKKYEDALREWERAAALDPANRTYQVNLRRLHDIRRRCLPSGDTHGDQE